MKQLKVSLPRVGNVEKRKRNNLLELPASREARHVCRASSRRWERSGVDCVRRKESMKTMFYVAGVIAMMSFTVDERAEETKASAPGATIDMAQAIFKNYQDLTWNKILPELGDSSPEICILHVDPKTQATKLMIRAPKGIHVRKHWHSANETHSVIRGTQ